MDNFANQLNRIIREKKIPIKYPRGYKKWKEKFHQAYRETRDVGKALDKIHGTEKAPETSNQEEPPKP